MKIDFNDCVIRHDGRQYILSSKRIAEKGKYEGQEVESVIGYYPAESQLLNGLIRHGMGSDAITSIEQISEMIDSAMCKLTTEKSA